MKIIWKKINGFDGYEVSNTGLVRSVDRYINGNFYKGKLLSMKKKNSTYQVILYKKGKKYKRLGYKLVAEMFLGYREGIDGLRKINGDSDNVNNLEVISE